MSGDLTSRRHLLKVAGTAAVAAVFGFGIALDSASLANLAADKMARRECHNPTTEVWRRSMRKLESSVATT